MSIGQQFGQFPGIEWTRVENPRGDRYFATHKASGLQGSGETREEALKDLADRVMLAPTAAEAEALRREGVFVPGMKILTEEKADGRNDVQDVQVLQRAGGEGERGGGVSPVSAVGGDDAGPELDRADAARPGGDVPAHEGDEPVRGASAGADHRDGGGVIGEPEQDIPHPALERLPWPDYAKIAERTAAVAGPGPQSGKLIELPTNPDARAKFVAAMLQQLAGMGFVEVMVIGVTPRGQGFKWFGTSVPVIEAIGMLEVVKRDLLAAMRRDEP